MAKPSGHSSRELSAPFFSDKPDQVIHGDNRQVQPANQGLAQAPMREAPHLVVVEPQVTVAETVLHSQGRHADIEVVPQINRRRAHHGFAVVSTFPRVFAKSVEVLYEPPLSPGELKLARAVGVGRSSWVVQEHTEARTIPAGEHGVGANVSVSPQVVLGVDRLNARSAARLEGNEDQAVEEVLAQADNRRIPIAEGMLEADFGELLVLRVAILLFDLGNRCAEAMAVDRHPLDGVLELTAQVGN